VTPGLIDLHTHSYGYFAWTFTDEYAFPAGVTTVVDAGGSGYRNFDDFKRTIIDKANVRLLALLSIVGGGMLGPVEQDTAEIRPEPCAEVVRANPDVIVGVKAAHYRGRGWESVDGAVEAGELSGTVAMIDYSNHPDRTYRKLITEHMRPGDMHTHMYGQQHAQIDEKRKVYDYVWEARKRGVLFDVGHGGGSFWFRVAVPTWSRATCRIQFLQMCTRAASSSRERHAHVQAYEHEHVATGCRRQVDGRARAQHQPARARDAVGRRRG
jgi:dihydroorotase